MAETAPVTHYQGQRKKKRQTKSYRKALNPVTPLRPKQVKSKARSY
ncbi:MAG: hypothetical protein V3V96_16565 [Acidiferrobacterales bacterium]